MAMRMMDDIIDLELEKVEQIIEKIAADPEDEPTCAAWSWSLWKKSPRHGAQKGRRTGPRHHGRRRHARRAGDCVYGSEEAIAFAVEVQKTLAVELLTGASVEDGRRARCLPGLRRSASEKDNPMIARIREADPALYERDGQGRAAATSPC